MEGHVQLGEAAILRGAVSAEQAAHGEAPGLPVPAPAQAHLHRGRQEAPHLRVQVPHEGPKARDEELVVRHATPPQPGHFALFIVRQARMQSRVIKRKLKLVLFERAGGYFK